MFIACALPVFKLPGNVDRAALLIKSDRLRVVVERSAFTPQITAVCFPLPSNLVLQIGNSDRATLVVRSRAFPFPPAPRLLVFRLLRA